MFSKGVANFFSACLAQHLCLMRHMKSEAEGKPLPMDKGSEVALFKTWYVRLTFTSTEERIINGSFRNSE
jgi:hypothetical protein